MGRSVKVSTRPLWMLLRQESTSTNKGLFMTCSGFTESREQMLPNGGTVRPAKHPVGGERKAVGELSSTPPRHQCCKNRPNARVGVATGSVEWPKDSHADLGIPRHPSGK